jgi:hypothetical protein
MNNFVEYSPYVLYNWRGCLKSPTKVGAHESATCRPWVVVLRLQHGQFEGAGF